MMHALRPVFLANGLLLLILGLSMLVPALLDVLVGHIDWQVFLAAAFFTSVAGGGLAVTSRGSEQALTLRNAFILTTSAWLVMPAFAALPFAFSELELS